MRRSSTRGQPLRRRSSTRGTCPDADWGINDVPSRQQGRGAPRKVTCEECFFKRNLLCALALDEPCATFRPNEAQLRPPKQLQFVFRQERRSQAAWAFPTAQEQAALHA
jgi:hypothetical protein